MLSLKIDINVKQQLPVFKNDIQRGIEPWMPNHMGTTAFYIVFQVVYICAQIVP